MRRWWVAAAAALSPALFVYLLLMPGRAAAEASPDVGWLGISISDVGEELADRLAGTFGPGAGTGVLVADVLKGGPAEGTTLKRGDVIVRVDAQPIWDVRQLQRTIRGKPINQPVALTILRETSRIVASVTVGPMPLMARAQLAGERFGFLVRDDDEREPRRDRPASPGRIVVAFVDSDSPAAHAGLRPLDVIVRINDQPIQSLEEFDRVMRRGDRPTTLLVERRDVQAPVVVNLEPPAR